MSESLTAATAAFVDALPRRELPRQLLREAIVLRLAVEKQTDTLENLRRDLRLSPPRGP